MKLIANWKTIARRAHSMWAFYASLICLLLPEAIYWSLQIDTNPRVWWCAGVALLIYGIAGRLWDQKIDQSKAQSPWVLGFLVLVLAMSVALGQAQGRSNVQPASSHVITSETANPDHAFLEVAIPFVARWEGLSLTAYLDIVGVPTVCYGETAGVRMGDSYTKAECDAMLARQLIDYRDRLRPAFTADTLATRLPIPRDVAFMSLAYNVGVHGTSKSTAVRRLNAGNIKGACSAIGWWNKAGGRVVRGLVNRRSDETDLCLQGVA